MFLSPAAVSMTLVSIFSILFHLHNINATFTFILRFSQNVLRYSLGCDVGVFFLWKNCLSLTSQSDSYRFLKSGHLPVIFGGPKGIFFTDGQHINLLFYFLYAVYK